MGGLVSSIGGMFGIGGNQNNFQAQQANIVDPTSAAQTDNLYNQAQGGLQQQQQLAQALSAQNGIQNQSNVYNQLQGVANGTGPNPAQAQLAQATGANVANQAALMAGQRGAGANVGLEARQAAQQGAATQQNAIGQAATLQANQSLNALNSAGSIAGQQVGNQIGAVQEVNSAVQGEQGQLLNATAANNNANVAATSNQNSTNQAMANTNANNANSNIGGALKGAGALIGLADGGQVPSHLDMVNKIYGNSYKQGGQIPGKAKVAGDSLKNDTVPAKLSPGEMVIPRSVMQSKDPAAAAAEFVRQHMKKESGGGGDVKKDFKSALKKAIEKRGKK